jgi:hypothetical protein
MSLSEDYVVDVMSHWLERKDLTLLETDDEFQIYYLKCLKTKLLNKPDIQLVLFEE